MWGIFKALDPGERPGAAGQQAQAGGIIFLTVLQDNLRPQTDAQDGDAALETLAQGLIQTQLPERGHGLAGRSHPGEDDAGGLGHHRRVLGHRTLHPQGLERPDYAGEVAGLIIDDDDHGVLNKGEIFITW